MPSSRVYELLEFNKIRQSVAAFAVLSHTKEKLCTALPSFNFSEISTAQSLTIEADVMLNKLLLDPIVSFDPIDELLEKARVDATLGMGELLKVARLLRAARIARSTITSATEEIVLLKRLVEGIFVDKLLENNITDVILSDTEISDKASDKLYGLRRKIATLNVKLKEKLLSYTKNNNSSKYLQDNLVTIREGRYVLPVKSECRGEVAGLVHDKSATGSTVYIEPFAIVELNNELRYTIGEEQAEIERILREFTRRVSACTDLLYVSQNICVSLDEVFAKAKYSVKINGTSPTFNEKGVLSLKKARHPLIDKDKVVAIDVELGGDFSVLMITGPNTGGKTVSLKTTGLLCLMAYFGLMLPCENANVCLYDDIFCDIGDNQSIESELSTFSSHMTCLIKIIKNISNKSLVLLDELCGGTDPEEGAALAIGFVNKIINVGCSAILTTHYGQLKEFAMTTKSVRNASMQFNEETFAPTYKLVMGMPGSSNALKIAKRLGVDDDIISIARKNLSEEKRSFEKILSSAEEIKRKSEVELDETRRLTQQLLLEKSELERRKKQLDLTMEKIRANAAAETKRLVSSAVERANEIIEEMTAELKNFDDAALLRSKKMRRELENLDYTLNSEAIVAECVEIKDSEIVVGAEVVVKSLNSSGIVKSVNVKRKEAEVQIGSVKMKLGFSNLGKPIKKKILPAPKNRSYVNVERVSSGFTQREIVVLGMTVSEALEQIEPFVLSMANEDDAKTLRIVHGKGTGALGRGIQDFLKTNPLVLEYRYGRYGEGDSGVTIVTVK